MTSDDDTTNKDREIQDYAKCMICQKALRCLIKMIMLTREDFKRIREGMTITGQKYTEERININVNDNGESKFVIR